MIKSSNKIIFKITESIFVQLVVALILFVREYYTVDP